MKSPRPRSIVPRIPHRRPPWQSPVSALIIAPCCSLFVILFFFLFTTSGTRVGSGYTTCCTSHSENLPRIAGPDLLQRGPVLKVDPDLSTLDGAEIDQGPRSHDEDSPDWKISRLAEQLEVKKHNWVLTNPGEAWEGSVLLQAHGGLNPQQLKHYLYSIQLAMGDRLQLATLSADGYSATRVQLIPLEQWAPVHSKGPHILQLEDFSTYEELVQEAVARRRAGRPVYISII